MIYKIIGDFEAINFARVLDELNKYCVILFSENSLYIGLKSIEYNEVINPTIKKLFKPAKKFYIEEINSSNINLLSPIIKDWCLNNFVKLDRQKYEKANQEKLLKVWEAIDKMEEELSAIINNK